MFRICDGAFPGLDKDQLKPHQKGSCIDVLNGKDVSIVQPPGGGKSMCFVLPTLVSSRRALVVEPVPPLMFDQKESLEEKVMFNVMKQ